MSRFTVPGGRFTAATIALAILVLGGCNDESPRRGGAGGGGGNGTCTGGGCGGGGGGGGAGGVGGATASSVELTSSGGRLTGSMYRFDVRIGGPASRFTP